MGITDPDELARHAAELRARGVSTTTFGVGNDFDEALLQAMADAGGGHFYYIADAAQIRDHIASEVGEPLEVVARDVALEVLAGEGVQVETISPQRARRARQPSVVALGDLVAEQGVEVVLRLTFPFGDLGRETGLIVAATDREGVFAAAGVARCPADLDYADDRANDAQPRDSTSTARSLASSPPELARTRSRSTAPATSTRPRGGSTRPRSGSAYAGRDRELRALVAELEAEAQHSTPRWPRMASRRPTSTRSNTARSRDLTGKALRRS